MSRSLPPESPLDLADLRHRYDRARFIPLLLTASVLVHEVLFLGWLFYRRGVPVTPTAEAEPIPLEFVALDDPVVPVPNPETNRIAQRANQGGEQTSADRPRVDRVPSAEAAGQTSTTRPARSQPAAPAESSRSQSAPQSASQPVSQSSIDSAAASPATPSLSSSSPGAPRADTIRSTTIPAPDYPPTDTALAPVPASPPPLAPTAAPRPAPTPPSQPLSSASQALGTGSLSAQNWQPHSQMFSHDRSDQGVGVTTRADAD
ncbi:MAG: hypothetical protein VKJ85_14305 [Prochlorothrix sp.]|nr:hypothetical protein [Prochlorothrix sp.]